MLKIKQAYDEYIRKSAQGFSPKSPAPTYEDLSSQLHQAELEIASLRQKQEESQALINKLRQEAEDRFRQMDSLTLENERLKARSSLKLPENGLSKSYTMSEIGKSLQLSNNGSHRLVQKNAELQQLCGSLTEEIEY